MSSEAVKILGFRQTGRNGLRKREDSVTDSLINRQTDKKTDRQAGGKASSVWSGGSSRAGEALFMWLAVMLSKYSC